MIPVYPLEDLQSNGTRIHEVYDFPNVYYVITYNASNGDTFYWKIDKKTSNMTVSSWPNMIVETKGAVEDDSNKIATNLFLNKIGLN